MPFSERPPLDDYICEKIDAELHEVDKLHWPQITAMRVKNYHAPDEPVPKPMPKHLLQEIEWYAERLFKVEADYYDEFQNEVHYGGWLSGLVGRVTARVIKSLETLENSDTNALHNLFGVRGGLILGYHGLVMPQVEQHLLRILNELRSKYEQGKLEGQRRASRSPLGLMDNQAADFTQASAPIHTQRRAAIELLLQEKGWSILDWAMAANVSHATAMDFLNEKTNPYRSTRLKLAKALGIPVGRLPQ